MERKKGLRRFLSHPAVYSWFQNLVGAERLRSRMAADLWRVAPGARVIDLGCGPADVLAYLPPDVAYTGIDLDETYIRWARTKFGNRARTRFLHGDACASLDSLGPASADLVMCNGLLHHLTDREVHEVLTLGKRLLKHGGRMVCFDACFAAGQSRIARWLMKMDRGAHIRSQTDWTRLVGAVFDHYDARLRTDLLRVPYVHIVIECHNR